MTQRNRLPNRRPHETFDFVHDGVAYTMSVGDAEVFVSCSKNTSTYEALARDAAVLISLALQYGTPAEVMRGAITRLDNGEPASLTGRMLDEMIR